MALAVVSIGLLGMIGLELHNLKSSHQAYLASMTSIQALDLEERMRANLKAKNTYLSASLTKSRAASTTTNCASSACTRKQLAVYDLDYKHQWLATTYSVLPGSTTITLYAPGNAPTCKAAYYELTYSWPKHNNSGGSTASYQYCFQLVPNP